MAESVTQAVSDVDLTHVKTARHRYRKLFAITVLRHRWLFGSDAARGDFDSRIGVCQRHTGGDLPGSSWSIQGQDVDLFLTASLYTVSPIISPVAHGCRGFLVGAPSRIGKTAAAASATYHGMAHPPSASLAAIRSISKGHINLYLSTASVILRSAIPAPRRHIASSHREDHTGPSQRLLLRKWRDI